MNRHFIPFLIHDMRLQLRNGIYYAYAFVLAFYLAILIFAGDFIPTWALALFIYTDPAVLGFFFLGALILLEKAEGTRAALAVSPISATTYFWTKAITLTGVALLAAIIFALVAKSNTNWPLYLVSIVLISLTFISIGFPIALRFNTVTGYLMGSAAILTPIALPMFLALFDPMALVIVLIPTAAQFRLLLVSVGTFQADTLELGLMLLVTTLTALISMVFAIRSLKKEFGDK